MKYDVILQNGRYALIRTQNNYIVACGFNKALPMWQQWENGIYFTFDNSNKMQCLAAAMECYQSNVCKDYIPRKRLKELAEQLIKGLMEDDTESAMYYFEHICEMTDAEKTAFGIE